MGQAKQRKAEITALKANGPKEKKRRKLKLDRVSDVSVAHFKNAAARAEAIRDWPQTYSVIRNSKDLTLEVNAGSIPAKLVHRVDIKIRTVVESEKPPRQAKQAEPLVLVVGRKLTDEEFFTHALALAHATPNGNGFRQPSANPKNWKTTSLMEKLSIRMGISEERTCQEERSDRGKKKAIAAQETKALIVLDRLIAEHTARAYDARHNERLVDWFAGKVMLALEGDIDREWLVTAVKGRIKKDETTKYMHVSARKRAIASSEAFLEAA